ncbi:hypothetical protein BDV59DRAFT_176430 [Aspergillus ambiguus]|uniref:uncharacterized protein n=1 Tax=Aspergillus ambiguus TaxID=176160 RepID=UPI003CCCF4EF
MNPSSLLLLSLTLVPFGICTPTQNEMMMAGTSCQIQGGDNAANLACKAAWQEQGPEWTGGYCDDKQICHCTFGEMRYANA